MIGILCLIRTLFLSLGCHCVLEMREEERPLQADTRRSGQTQMQWAAGRHSEQQQAITLGKEC